jgi:hypothetical protein
VKERQRWKFAKDNDITKAHRAFFVGRVIHRVLLVKNIVMLAKIQSSMDSRTLDYMQARACNAGLPKITKAVHSNTGVKDNASTDNAKYLYS